MIKADGYRIVGTSGFSNYGYNELFTYDKHGNILNLQRKKGTTYIDWINPAYNGNQMTFANDYYFSQNQSSVKEYHNFNTSGNDFSYDANGNMTKDLDRKIYTIRYNVLNLPEVLGADQNNVYALSSISGGEHKVRQGSDGKVYIETSSDALSIHEITHVRQSLDAGGLKFSTNGELLNAGVGIKGISNMEIVAYKMQYSYDRSVVSSPKNSQI